jgi:hypothetical protein
VAAPSTPQEIVEYYYEHGFRPVFWPAEGDTKGPNEKGWPNKFYYLADYNEKKRVGLLTGVELSERKFLHDVDLDWSPGAPIALKLLPGTDFVYGRESKKVSHCFYTLPEGIPTLQFKDLDGQTLIELRGTKADGTIGFQSMVPPSIWQKEDKSEPLVFARFGDPGHVEAKDLKQRVCLSAIGMLLARHLGHNGFGPEARLCWAGFLLRLGIPKDDLIAMGEGMSVACNNLEVHDVRPCIESTHNRLQVEKSRVKGGPALAKLIGQKGREVLDLINDWLGNNSDFERTKDGTIVKDSQINITRAMNMLGVEFSYNEFAERMLVRTQEHPKQELLSDYAINELWLEIDREYGFRPTFQFFERVVMHLSHQNRFHPVRDYLKSLTWDGTPRIEQWLVKYGGAENTEYVQTISALVLIAAVRRVMSPGAKFDELLVIEGKQGVNKSSAIRALCPEWEWFSDDLPLNVDSKVMIEKTLGKWIIEASDMAGKRKTENEQLKATLSRQVDGPARMAYARIPVERARQFIVLGTTNSKIYGADSTGARRLWPVEVTRFDVEGITRDRDQLWAEAAQCEKNFGPVRLPERLWSAAGEEQDKRQEIDPWEMILSDLLNNRAVDSSGRIRVPLSEIWEVIQPDITRRDRSGGIRISEIMQRLGYERGTMRVGGEVIRAYLGRPSSFEFVPETE